MLRSGSCAFYSADQPLLEISKDGNFGECYFQDATYGSDDMAFSIGLKNTAEECQLHCQNTTGCKYFVYEGKPKRCQLKSFEDDLYYSKGTIAGPRYCGELHHKIACNLSNVSYVSNNSIISTLFCFLNLYLYR